MTTVDRARKVAAAVVNLQEQAKKFAEPDARNPIYRTGDLVEAAVAFTQAIVALGKSRDR